MCDPFCIFLTSSGIDEFSKRIKLKIYFYNQLIKWIINFNDSHCERNYLQNYLWIIFTIR
ncbi:hypothetical protein XIS1_1030026 [Xenorhabdus innexi]|uniref:Uncharacterized protein n=1 Tax=Xenorhabdus innexi TaxID=290109 RepID=A0A1N6MQ73_9GAMM|nr:hypothetical protein XIS1_1030026 [Xenorhabdus innexi]